MVTLLVTIFGVALPLVLFQVQISSQERDKISSVYAVTRYNCIKAQNIIDQLKNPQSGVISNYYLIESYKDNLQLFYQKLGATKFDWALEVVALMDTANSLIKNAQDINEYGIDEKYASRGMLLLGKFNNDIVSTSEKIKKRLAQINDGMGGPANFCEPNTIPN